VTKPDRRKRTRLRLKLPVIFLRPESDSPLQTETLDISNNGFYSITAHPFAPGEKLKCLIGVGTRLASTSDPKHRLWVEAEVDVVRIVVTNGTGFGVACRISDYRVLAGDALPSWALQRAEHASLPPPVEQLV
jgi:PilZ domain